MAKRHAVDVVVGIALWIAILLLMIWAVGKVNL